MGPFLMGFVVQNLHVDWIFTIVAIINFCPFFGYLVLDAETLYLPSDTAIDLQDP